MSLFSITAKASGWKAIISALKNSSEEAQFEITNDGIKFYGAPPGNAFIVSMLWEKQNLNELTLDAEKIVPFRTDDIEKIFKRFSVDDIVTVSQKQDGLISITSGKRSWDLRTLYGGAATDSPKEPNFEYAISFALNPTILKDMLADVAVFAKFVHFVAKDGVLALESTEDAGKAKSYMDILDSSQISEEADTEYSLEYIGDVMSAVSTLSTSVQVSFSHQKPMLMEFEIPNAGTLRFHLGPLLVN
jgi:DNA polymerase III sliding clamp (beta) subunit (PCNA family)